MSSEVQGLPRLPEDDRPHELQTDLASEEDARESVRRHNARQVAHGAMYPYDLEATPEENDASRRLREQTIESGPQAIREAEDVVTKEHERIKHLYEASDGKEEIRIEDFVSDERKTDE